MASGYRPNVEKGLRPVKINVPPRQVGGLNQFRGCGGRWGDSVGNAGSFGIPSASASCAWVELRFNPRGHVGDRSFFGLLECYVPSGI